MQLVGELQQLYGTFYQAGDRNCGTKIVGPDVIDEVLIALPVRTEKESLVSYLIANYLAEQRYGNGLQDAKLNKWPINCPCAVTPGAECIPEDDSPLKVEASQLTLFFLLMVILTLGGLLCAGLKPCGTIDRGCDGRPGGLC